MVLNVSESESADLARMLQSRSWEVVMRHFLNTAASERKNILGGVITEDRVFELRAAQAGIQRIKSNLTEVYAAAKLKTPAAIENMLG